MKQFQNGMAKLSPHDPFSLTRPDPADFRPDPSRPVDPPKYGPDQLVTTQKLNFQSTVLTSFVLLNFINISTVIVLLVKVIFVTTVFFLFLLYFLPSVK